MKKIVALSLLDKDFEYEKEKFGLCSDVIFCISTVRKKEDVIRRLITINRQVCSIYKEITYIPFTWDTEYGKLALSYYLEYYDNELKKKMKIENAKILKKYPVKIRKQLSKVISKQFTFATNQLHTKELHNYLIKHPHLLEIGTNNKELSPEQKMKDIIAELDDKIVRLKELYAKIRVLDLRELDNCVQEVNTFTRFTIFKKLKIKHNIPDSKIFPEINKLSLNEIAQRIYNTHERITNLIDGWYKHESVDEQGKYNKKEVLSLMLLLQNVFLCSNTISIKGEECVHNIGYTYNQILFVEANLEQMLLYDLYGILKFISHSNFALTKDSIENGHRITVALLSGNHLNTDIFRS